MVPPTAVGQWSLDFYLTRRFGSNDYIIHNSVASGFNGVSGITIVNSGAGIMNITNLPQYMSGKNPGPYAWTLRKTDSGLQTEVARGFRLTDY